MTDSIDANTVRDMLEAVCLRVVAAVDLLTEADLAIGDGDHGVGMRRGFEGALEALKAQPEATVEGHFRAVGTAVMSKTGGAAGAVFGTLFRAGGKALEGRERLDADGFAAFLDAGLEAVMKRGGVSEGQKTMVDALAPAARAVAEQRTGSLPAAIAAASTAAESGREATRAMIATTGKARSLGERSIGHVDPGAVSVTLIFAAMNDFLAGR